MSDDFNMSMRKFLKQVGVTSQQAIEEAARDKGVEGKTFEARAVAHRERPRRRARRHRHDQGVTVALTRDAVLAALKEITDPVSGSDVVSAGIIRALTVEGGSVRFVLEIDPARAEAYKPVRDEC